MDFAGSVLNHRSPTFYWYFAAGWIFGASASALLLTSLAGLLCRKVRRRMAAAAGAISLIFRVSAVFCLCAHIYELAIVMASPNFFEKFTFFHARMGGYYSLFYWSPVAGNLLPQLFWWRRCRRALWITAIVAALVLFMINLGSLIVFVTAQSQDFLPNSWIQSR